MWRSRTDGRPADSIKQFHRHLRVLNGTEPHGYSRALTAQAGSAVITAPMSYSRPQRTSVEMRRRRTLERRRNVLFILTGLCVATLLFSFVAGAKMLALNVMCDALLGAYGATVVPLRNPAGERNPKVRYLPRQQPVLDLRNDAGSFYDEVSSWADTNG